MNINDIEKLEKKLRDKIKSVGVNEASRILGINKAYVSKVSSGTVTPSTKKVLELLEKLNSAPSKE